MNITAALEHLHIHCYVSQTVYSSSYFVKGDPTQFSLPLLLLQLSFVTFLSCTLQFLLKPFGQPRYVSHIIAGLTLGPSLLSHSETFKKKMFPPKSDIALDVYSQLGCMFFLFLDGVRIDLTVLKKAGRLAIVIGFSSFFVPLILTASAGYYLQSYGGMERKLLDTLPFVAALQSSCSCHVVACILTDLNLLNSEFGRLALSSSLISGTCGFCLVTTIMGIKQVTNNGGVRAAFLILSTRIVLLAIVAFIFRPIMYWMLRRTSEGKTLKEGYICGITLMILVCALFGEITGSHALFGPMILGMAVPESVIMASDIFKKLDCFVSVVLLPSFILTTGLKVNVFIITKHYLGMVELIIFISFVGKLVAALVPLLYCKMPFVDSLSLCLILNCQGLFDINYYTRALESQIINEQSFTIMTIMAMLYSAALAPLVRAYYEPSRKYVAYKTRTIQHSKPNMELRILACVHNDDNVPTIVNILEASNPTIESPICVYILHLMELAARTSPFLIPHKTNKKLTSYPSKTECIMKAFRYFEQINQGVVSVQCFTGIAPYATMHNDVCMLALEKKTSLVIIPFHKSAGRPVRTVNQNILAKIPCSVGILIDRGILHGPRTVMTSHYFLRVAVIFLGGPDDREALAYGKRMSNHPSINLTVVHLLTTFSKNNASVTETKPDGDAINEFKISSIDNERIVYREEEVLDGAGTASMIRSMASYIDLILVGRRHENKSPLLSGLTEWSEFLELGIIGDMLASPDFMGKVSILVVQQQASVVEEMVYNPRYFSSQLQVYDSTSLSNSSKHDQF